METPRAFEIEFRLRAARLDDAAFLVSPAGDLDFAAVPQLAHTLDALDGHQARRLIVDLTDVTFLDTAALGTLVAEARTRRTTGGELVLVCDDRHTLRALDVAGLGAAFEVRRTLREALEAEPGR